DDSLVKIENGENYLKVSGNYVWISGPDGIPGVYVAPKSADFPVQDSATLQPVDISANTNKQFWITVKVPDNAIAGDYSGTITLTTPSGTVGQIQLNLRVLPIELSESMVTPSIYYWGCLGTGNFTNGTISFIMKSPTQFKAELKNLVDHGITNPTVYQSLDEPKLREVLQLRREAGMIDDSMYYLGLKPYGYQDPSQVATTVSIAKDYGIDNVYFYGVDEAKGNALAVQKDAWEAIRRAGGKIFASGVRAGHYSDPERSPGNFGYMGDIQDLLVCHGVPYAEEAERWHSYDHEIFCYSNPQVGEEKPETYRRNFGLLLWQRDYDGMMDFSYQHRFGNVWNDFDDSTYRDHVFTYPTVNGVIDTIQWEGQREGIDDLRYLTTLLNTIETAKTQGKGTSSAEDYLSSLKDSDLASKDLETIRSEIIAHILSLQQELVP
ncbi:MAG: hypothetical protein GY845_29190, partial [Planctomycetes bacterium]|nr:hypothetical protein [Planctomycetota bacterium]